ncbi:MAG TPA: ParA family protein [Nitrososphaeraceae archaeon]|nr:ParA family protein [Nitrososphaeraceae archaeon]HJY15572.1 ParA family protein [Nitrososphaeraceae archaeon]
MKRTKCIAFHSYKGGTGKTTLASNFAALLVREGHRVCLLDLDVYAPSLQSYFEIKPQKWINDYLDSNAEVGEIMLDCTSIIEKTSITLNSVKKRTNSYSSQSKEGKLWIGFSSAKKEEIQKLEGIGNTGNKKQFLRKFMLLREQLVSDYDADYIIVDTSPGIRQWSINVLAVADILLLTLKMGDLDIDGTKKIVEEVYNIFTGFGTPSFLLCNRVAGYCVPHTYTISKNSQGIIELQKQEETSVINSLSSQIGMKIISSIPCYCDIQFLKKEFLTVLKYPDHPFAKQLEKLIELLLL